MPSPSFAVGGITGSIRSVVGGVLTALLNFANTTSTASRSPAANRSISGFASSTA